MMPAVLLFSGSGQCGCLPADMPFTQPPLWR